MPMMIVIVKLTEIMAREKASALGFSTFLHFIAIFSVAKTLIFELVDNAFDRARIVPFFEPHRL